MSFPIVEQLETSPHRNAGRKAARNKANDAAQKLELLQLEDRLVPAGQITGQVFLDFNSNGLLDTSTTLSNDGFGTYTRQTDKGVAAVVVQAYDSSNVLQGAATTAADGTYTLAATGTGGYRLEFSNVPAGNFTGPQGANAAPPPQGSRTSVQFVPDGNSTNRNLSISLPSGFADNPQIITSSYLIGDQSGLLATGPKFGTANFSTFPVIISFPYSAGTTQQDNVPNAQIPTAHALAVQAQFVGTTWGLAQNTNTNTILASAFTKKHTGYGPSGSGAIYTMGTTGTTATLWLDLGAAVAGGNFRSGYTNNDDYFTDSGNTGWDAVGKTSFGGLAINSTNTEVYVMNLADRKLYTIQVNPNGSAGAITSILIPTPANATGNVTGLNRGDLRPFAVEYRNGLVYVGMVNSAESTQARSDLRAYVYTYNPTTQAWGTRSVINESGTADGFRLDYARATSFGGSDNFLAWSNVFANVNGAFQPGVNNAVKYPQPILSGIAFDGNGNLNLAFRDRAGDQLGNQIESDPALPGQLDLGISAGDLLKATNNNNGTWTLENNGVAGTTTGGVSNGEGPGGGEFYYQDDYDNGTHTDVSSGAVAQVPGFPDVISTTFDPVRQTNVTKAAGVRWYNETTGTVTKAYQIYDNTDAGTFGKATGTGDLLVVQPPAGREIGNRVFNDVNGNGRQDPGENGITGVQVVLFLGNTGFATATTDANGEYYFSSNAGTNTSNKIFGLNLAQAGTYTIGIPVVQGPLAGLSLTTSNVNANGEDQRDSDFTLNTVANRADFVVPTILAGESNHTFDAGFRLPSSAMISGFVYADRNNNGAFETGLGEPPISGVIVVLTGSDSVGNPITPLTTTTDSSGFYKFDNLVGGTYTVTETQPAAFLDGKDTAGSLGGNNAANDVLSGIILPTGGNSTDNNFGELEPAALNGFVYFDANDDGIFAGADTAIAGVTVVLMGTNDLGAIAPQTLTTSPTGFYNFGNLRPGTYKVTETQPTAFADGKETPGTPGGGTSIVNDVIDTITLTANLTSPNNNFGERPLAASSLSGYVYFDPNDDGVRGGPPGEPGIQGTIVVLTGVTTLGVTIVAQTQTTDAAGFYNFTGLQAGTYKVTETQPPTYLDGKDTAGNFGGTVTNDVIDLVSLGASVAGVNYNFGELRPLSIGDFVWDDANNNGTFDAGEVGLANVIVELVNTGVGTTLTASTNAQGGYLFTSLLSGTYQVQIRRASLPAGYVSSTGQNGSITAGPFESPAPAAADNRDGGTTFDATFVRGNLINAQYGALPTGETPTPGGIVDPAQAFSDANSDRTQDFGFFKPLNLGNLVYVDTNNDGQFTTGTDTPQDGVLVRLVRRATFNNTLQTLTATTAGGGLYLFSNLGKGDYAVEIDAPAGFSSATGANGTNVEPATQNSTDGQDKGTSQGGQLIRANDVLLATTDNLVQDFGLIQRASISGFVYHDVNNDGVRAGLPTEVAIPGTIVVLTGTVAGNPITPLTATTDATGFYQFSNLADGVYTVTETQPATYLDGKDAVGNFAGTLGNDVLSNVSLVAGNAGVNYNFGEILPGAINGFTYLDANNDGIFQPTETAIPGVVVVLTGTNDLGAIVAQTLTTGPTGAYSFTNLRPGTYKVTETQPAAYVDGRETPGTPGGGTSLVNDVIDTITLTSGLTSPNNNFGEQLLAQLSGYVYRDPNDDGIRLGAADTGIAGTIVVLTGTVNNQAIVPQTATTDASGFYQFTNLAPGTYTVTETQPPAFLDGKDTPGSRGGSNVVNDVLSGILLNPSDNAIENNFGEITPASVAGFVYFDTNDDGIFQPTETPIPGTTVVLTGVDNRGATIAPQTLTTGANGAYAFINLRPGTYKLTETQPAGFSDGKDTAGNLGGSNAVNDVLSAVNLIAGNTGVNYNFGERPLPGQLSGYVYRDPNVNGIREPGLAETGIPGTKVVLFFEGPNGPVAVQTAFTASDGFYRFTNLAPGNYRVVETQPLGFFDGLDTAGSSGGSNAVNDVLSTIPVTAGGNSVNNNFGEVPSVNLFGYVWIDNNRNGLFDPGEAGIPNAVVTISGTAFAGTPIANAINASQAPSGLSIVTDANGRYDFFKLPPGSYSLAQTNTPIGLSDFASQNAAPGLPIQLSTNTTFTGIGLNAPAPGPLNFGKVSEGGPTSPLVGDPSKQAFLGSSPLGVAGPTGNPLVGPPTVFVNTNPTFGATNSTSVKPVYLAAGAGAGFSPTVRVFNYRTGAEIFRFLAFDVNFLGGVETATGDVNNDGTPDIIVAAGAGAGPHVKAFDGLTGAEIRSFYAYDPNFRGGVMVASGDVDGDGFDDIITGAMSNGAPHVKAFSGKTGQELASFYAFDSTLTTGVRVAATDIDGDGKADIVASTGAGTPARVRAFSGTTQTVLSDFSPFSGFTGGVFVAAGDFDGDGKGDIFVTAGAGGGPRVSVFNAGGTELTSFYSGDPSLTSGIRVAAKDLNGDGRSDIITGAGIGTASRISAFSGAGLGLIEDFYLFDSGVRTGVFVG